MMQTALFSLLLANLTPLCWNLQLPRTQNQRSSLALHASLVVGVNKYSHDASISIVDKDSGEVLFSQAKERVTTVKHDYGATGSLLKFALSAVGAELSDVKAVVSNNHHFRVLPFERRIKFYKSINYIPSDYDDIYNVVPDAEHFELSHHLAHAWSAISVAPFSKGLILVADGMGEAYRSFAEDLSGSQAHSGDYMHDLRLIKAYGAENFVGQPTALSPGSTYREAETAYVFDSSKSMLRPVFKRWSRERSPPELYNQGFENMESLGAVYSRIASHVLGDWNSCGKIMGLAPWHNKVKNAAADWIFPADPSTAVDSRRLLEKLELGDNFYHKVDIMSGNPFDGTFSINWDVIDNLPHPNEWSDARFGYYANLAHSVQSDLESCAMQLVNSLRDFTGESNLALVGGVALNSVMNSKIRRECGFDNVFVPPGTGDEGIAVGCAYYGLQRLREREKAAKSMEPSNIFNFERSNVDRILATKDGDDVFESLKASAAGSSVVEVTDGPDNSKLVPFLQQACSAYSCKQYTPEDIADALYELDPWIQFRQLASAAELVEDSADSLAQEKIIAWFQGKSEFGQRALGHRSILASPLQASTRTKINRFVKNREWYRPLAPSVLVEHVHEYFDDVSADDAAETANFSPYMSFTATIKKARVAEIPAVAHVDNTARLQTVSRSDNSNFYELISRFRALSQKKTPMVLNTSFNKNSQPIVETPMEAIKTFITSAGSIDLLYLELFRIELKPFPFQNLDEPDDAENEIVVRCSGPLYLSEVTSSPTNSGLQPVKIRIQDTSYAVDGAQQQGGSETAAVKWMELPSLLHLEILQLLQAVDSSDQQSAYESSMDEDLTIAELYGALKQIRTPEYDDDRVAKDVESSWPAVREALRFLHRNCLVYFQDPRLEQAPEDLFKGAEIVDLRSIT